MDWERAQEMMRLQISPHITDKHFPQNIFPVIPGSSIERAEVDEVYFGTDYSIDTLKGVALSLGHLKVRDCQTGSWVTGRSVTVRIAAGQIVGIPDQKEAAEINVRFLTKTGQIQGLIPGSKIRVQESAYKSQIRGEKVEIKNHRGQVFAEHLIVTGEVGSQITDRSIYEAILRGDKPRIEGSCAEADQVSLKGVREEITSKQLRKINRNWTGSPKRLSKVRGGKVIYRLSEDEWVVIYERTGELICRLTLSMAEKVLMEGLQLQSEL
ncbi:hypothetical protein [Seinonella peptonophila]|uniref:hypothetical protein n=1 Tax=Seinonella peptonophila TaxID=112248 RepID=UPI0009354BA7|nr:hypothetical protein [Seinonella peptonophila]